MKRERVLEQFRERHAQSIIDFQDKSPKRVYVEIRPERLVEICSHLFRELGARFNIASGMDLQTHIEILYHFTLEEINLLISLRVKLDRSQPEIDSLAPVLEAANWVEREIHELLGVHFRGHPDLRRLLLPPDWPKGVFPLRRDYEEWDKTAIRDRGVQ